jgi:hypothetical protein
MEKTSREVKRALTADPEDTYAAKRVRLDELRAGRFLSEEDQQRPGIGWSRIVTVGDRFKLSIQAGEGLYSSPRDNSQSSIDVYESVEIALFDQTRNGMWMSGNKGNAPTKAYAELTSYDDVAAYVNWPDVAKLITELTQVAIEGTYKSFGTLKD